MVFTVSEKLVKARDGESFDLSRYSLGTDYVVRRAFKGERRMFRKGILGEDHVVESTDMMEVTVVDLSLVEHKQDKTPILIKKDDLNLDKPVLMVRPASLDGSVRSAKVVKKHANQRYVDTDTLGRVFVGQKGNQIKVSQMIKVKDGVLYLGKEADVLTH